MYVRVSYQGHWHGDYVLGADVDSTKSKGAVVGFVSSKISETSGELRA